MKQPRLVVSLAVLALSLASVADAQESPLSVEGATTIQAAKAKTLFDRGVPFVDVRSNDLFEAAHIPGATHLNLFTTFNEANLLKVSAKDQEVVIHCAGPG